MELNTSQLNNLAGQLRRPGIAQPQAAPSTEVKERTEPGLGLMEKRTELMIEMSEKRLRNEITSLREDIKKVSEELRGLRDQIYSLARQNNIIAQNNRVQQNKLEISQKPEPPKKEQNTPRYLKRDDFKPEDISIEKIFYSGSKVKKI